MTRHVLEATQWIPATPDQAFEFFSNAANLETITPEFLNFKILTPLPIAMHSGTLIEYRIKLMGLPMRWLTRIEEWIPGERFVDVQLRGPYAQWIHSHTFASKDGGTELKDRVDYALPFEPLTTPVHALFVRRTVERIFAHRRVTIAHLFGGDG